MDEKRRLPISLLFFFRKKSKTIAVITLLAFINITVSCSFYKSKSLSTDPDKITKAYNAIHKKERYVILHSGSQIWHLDNVVLDEDKKEMTASFSDIEQSHKLFPLREGQKSRGYNKAKVKKALEIHFYANEINTDSGSSQVTIPFSDITKLEVYETDTGKVLLSVVGFTMAAIALVVIIVVATKSSCPFVYKKEGDVYSFSGELYPGAILPTLERDDYLPLPDFVSQNNEYELKITNELMEVQHTDLVQLIVANHSPDVEVLMDQRGNIHTVAKKESPNQVTINGYSGKVETIATKDNVSHLFDNDIKSGDWNNIHLSFENKHFPNNAKLVLSAKNALWFDLLYGKFNEQFGTYFNQFQKKQHKVPAEKNIQWRNDQGIPLSVYVKSGNEWVLVDRINPVGPLAFRDLVIPINLENIKSNKIEVKLECGFMFWEVDYAAIDFSPDVTLDVKYVNPSSAIDENGHDVTQLLSKADKNYLTQPEIGNEVAVKYAVNPPRKGEKQTVFLKNRGYYEYIRDYKNKPNIAKLKSFKVKGALSAYSKEEYLKLTQQDNLDVIVFHHE